MAVGAVLIGWQAPSAGAAPGLGLADGFAAGCSRLGHLPQKGPEGQTEIPAPVPGVAALVLLSQAPVRNPVVKEQFELVQSGAQGGAQSFDLSGEAAGPIGEIRCNH